MHKDNRAFCENPQTHSNARQEPSSNRSSLRCHQHTQQSTHCATCQQRIEHRYRTKDDPQHHRHMNHRRAVDERIAGWPKSLSDKSGQPQAENTGRRGNQSGRDLTDAGESPDGVDQPEQQRGFVAIGFAMEVRNQIVAAKVSLPGDSHITRFIHRQQRTANQHRSCQHHCQQDRPKQISHTGKVEPSKG